MCFSLRAFSTSIISNSKVYNSNNNNASTSPSHTVDAKFMKRAAELADKSAGFTAPHPNFGCVIVSPGNAGVVGEGYLYAQGTKAAELQAVEAAGAWCKGATAYINMEPGDCHGDQTGVSALIRVKKGDGEPQTYFPVPEENQKEVDFDPWPGAKENRSGNCLRVTRFSNIGSRMGLVILRGDDDRGWVTFAGLLGKAGISRVVVGIRHPLENLRGDAIRALRSEGLKVDVIGEELQSKTIEEALKSCLVVNAPLLYRNASQVPFSVLKYAMTLDGKIAASSGHASWISSRKSRTRVFELRGRSDAVIVGGNTVRKDGMNLCLLLLSNGGDGQNLINGLLIQLWNIDPRLTARHGGGHFPLRIVMSQTLNLPELANLWDVTEVPTIVATQRGARKSFQKFLASKGVEVVEFDMLNPKDVMEYLYDRGYLSVLWECGGTLAASAISSGVIHKVCVGLFFLSLL
ncbi:unnamed protein product [Ilex paraguariensis]|uniref:CMP/dCMP-type deaminase domain-containing protein n=1 Tax=Ilex paraguariensis TaxID=185542 RepID=A0ABC8T5N9_9AQUA